MLYELRAGSVRNEDDLRLKVHDDNLGFASVVCRMETFCDQSASWRGDHDNEFATDKHRMLWMISTRVLSGIGIQGNARSAAQRDTRTAKPKVTPDNLEAAYQSGFVF